MRKNDVEFRIFEHHVTDTQTRIYIDGKFGECNSFCRILGISCVLI